jgi:hypothetical protein
VTKKPIVLAAKATLRPANAGQEMIARSMLDKGRGFAGAALLLRKQTGPAFVVLHLLCQGLEIIWKAGLLLRSYKRYKPVLKVFSHDLTKSGSAFQMEYGLAIDAPTMKQLRALNQLYKQHWLRYATGYDILVNPRTIESEKVWELLGASIELIDRQLAASPAGTVTVP